MLRGRRLECAALERLLKAIARAAGVESEMELPFAGLHVPGSSRTLSRVLPSEAREVHHV
jgi:hypothetical protein